MTDNGNKIDFTRYKTRLADYLYNSFGLRVQNNVNFRCPLHDDGANPSEWSAIVRYDQVMTCYGCDFHGDIYDLCGEITGETNIAEQYKSVARSFGDITENGTYKPYTPPKNPMPIIPPFVPDANALSRIDAYLTEQKDFYLDQIAAFFKARNVPESLIGRCVAQASYWPGLREVSKDVSPETLDAAGIPDKAFIPAGVIVRLAVGYKLHYFDDKGSTIKRGSIASKTFPFPNMPDDPDSQKTVILCEGELDQITARAAGLDNVRSIGGVNGLRPKDAEQLRGYRVVLAMDNDGPGKTGTEKIGAMLSGIGVDCSVVDWTGQTEKDLDDMVKAGKVSILLEMIENAKPIEKKEDTNAGKDNRGFDSQGCAVVTESAQNIDTGNAIEPAGTANYGNNRRSESVDSGNADNALKIDCPADDLGPIKPADIPFQFLGFDATTYYVMPKNQNIPLSISRGERAIADKLCEIAPRDWWETLFTKTVYDKQGEPNEVFDKESAIDWFRLNAIKHGMYDDERILGLGAHIDNGKIMVNTGRAIVSPDGDVSTYEGYQGHNTYCRSKTEIVLGDKPWTESDGAFLIEQIKTFSFDTDVAYFAIPGFCALAPFASCLFRRPHIFITGARGLGKTYLLHDIIIPIIGNQTIYADAGKGGITEAGLRQTAGADCRPMVIDEFEANKKSDLAMVDNILALARTAYGGEKTIKGSSSQKAISFATKMMFCFAAVNVNIQDAATRSRFAICRMGKSKGKAKRIQNIDGLRSRIFYRLPTIRQEIETCHSLMEEYGFDSREADTYAPLFTGYWAIVSDAPFGDTTRPQDSLLLKTIIEAMGKIRIIGENEIDEEKILARIFQEKVRINADTEKTIAQMLTTVDDMKKMIYDEQVQLYGLRRMKVTDAVRAQGVNCAEILAVSAKNDLLSKMLIDTPFTNYKEVLKRNQAVVKPSSPVSIAGQVQSSILLDWQIINELYFADC